MKRIVGDLINYPNMNQISIDQSKSLFLIAFCLIMALWSCEGQPKSESHEAPQNEAAFEEKLPADPAPTTEEEPAPAEFIPQYSAESPEALMKLLEEVIAKDYLDLDSADPERFTTEGKVAWEEADFAVLSFDNIDKFGSYRYFEFSVPAIKVDGKWQAGRNDFDKDGDVGYGIEGTLVEARTNEDGLFYNFRYSFLVRSDASVHARVYRRSPGDGFVLTPTNLEVEGEWNADCRDFVDREIYLTESDRSVARVTETHVKYGGDCEGDSTVVVWEWKWSAEYGEFEKEL